MKQKVIVVTDGRELPAAFEKLQDVAEVVPVNSVEELRAARRTTDVVFVWDFQSDVVGEAGPEGLSWVHINSIGVDALMTPQMVQSPVVITNTRGVFEPPVAEWALASLLFFAKDMRRTVDLQREATWKPRPNDLVRGRRAVVVGAGGVGREIVRLLRAVGYVVNVVGRSAREDSELGYIHSTEELDALLPVVDDVVLAAPLTAATTRMFDARRFSLMRQGARLVNVGRGALLDEHALQQSLQSGHLAAAALDVFDQEPLPASHPFWAMENVFVSPHTSGDPIGWEDASVGVFIDNLRRWREREPLRNVIDAKQFATSMV